jgi:periplasmic divalent cation tolerance protein
MAGEQPITVMITAADRVEAGRLAELLVEARLGACVQILPGVISLYRYEGKIQRDEEVLLLVKTTAAAFPELEVKVRAAHSYETPEIVALPIIQGSAAYIEWLAENVGQPVES